jgi:pimeloyl-ACP methyl ester carboxylesterase
MEVAIEKAGKKSLKKKEVSLSTAIESIEGIFFDKDMKPFELPLWMETFVGIDWTLLHISPLYYGFGVPQGDGSPVILVPGFLANDFYLYDMYFWLKRIGYTPYLSNIGWNADCLNVLVNKLAATVAKAHEETGKKVHLIGHSLGGVLSRGAAFQHVDMVASVITMGSPFRGVKSHPFLLEFAEKIRRRIFMNEDPSRPPYCYTGYCDCVAVSDMQKVLPDTIKKTAIYSKTDGVVHWENCVYRDEKKNFEVASTHIGMAFNYQVYKLISERLIMTP